MRKTLITLRLILLLTTPAAAQTLPQPSMEQRSAVETACRTDVEKHCSGIQPGGGRIAVCLRDNQSSMSAGCKEAIAKLRASR